ncbi:hypothetical protein [Ranid herpesvirus 3]|uniref:Uncharacterized protein n=1 Tax=Ranid herpesvirus 3 TaxID=1987509 RepID=A0A1X9T589_9VIRU|nr:hypothetical protein [Ranid herpesvirus 3]ARR28868.1 hypothetical protein [Ranid herpesvirus 3]
MLSPQFQDCVRTADVEKRILSTLRLRWDSWQAEKPSLIIPFRYKPLAHGPHELLLSILESALATPLSDLEECVSDGCSLLDYDQSYAGAMGNYWLGPVDKYINKMIKIITYITRFPYLPNHTLDLRVCFHCLVDNEGVKRLDGFVKGLLSNKCSHYFATVDSTSETKSCGTTLSHGVNFPTMKEDRCIANWQESGDTSSLTKRVDEDEERRKRLQIKDDVLTYKTEERSNIKELIKSVQRKTLALRLKRRRLTAVDVLHSLEAFLVWNEAPKYLHVHAFHRLHLLIKHNEIRNQNASLPFEIPPRVETTSNIQALLESADLKNAVSKITNAFYKFLLPPYFVYLPSTNTINPRYNVRGLYFALGVPLDRFMLFKAQLTVDLVDRCKGKPYIGGDDDLHRLFWTVTNLYAFFVKTGGQFLWGRFDDKKFDCALPRGFYHVGGNEWRAVWFKYETGSRVVYKVTSETLLEVLQIFTEK